MAAGTAGCTPIDQPAPRWSAYIHKLRRMGVEVETLHERLGSPSLWRAAMRPLQVHLGRVNAPREVSSQSTRWDALCGLLAHPGRLPRSAPHPLAGAAHQGQDQDRILAPPPGAHHRSLLGRLRPGEPPRPGGVPWQEVSPPLSAAPSGFPTSRPGCIMCWTAPRSCLSRPSRNASSGS